MSQYHPNDPRKTCTFSRNRSVLYKCISLLYRQIRTPGAAARLLGCCIDSTNIRARTLSVIPNSQASVDSAHARHHPPSITATNINNEGVHPNKRNRQSFCTFLAHVHFSGRHVYVARLTTLWLHRNQLKPCDSPLALQMLA